MELLSKLWCFGFRGKIWCWLKAYLSHRLQCVSINGKKSSLLPVISGVPQGSILGPLLFLIFINDLPDSTHSSSLLLYADDAKCFRPIASPSDLQPLQDDLNSLFNWSLKWKLRFNISKCALLRLTSGYSFTQSPPYYINDEEIVLKDCHRDLGILISGNLSWTSHYELICSRAYRMLGLLRRVFSATVCVSAKKNLYTSLVRSQLSYCSMIWRPNLIKDIKCLETVQRRATKFILSDYSSDHRERLLSLYLLPLMMQLEIYDLVFFVKSLKYPSDSFNILDFVSFCSGSSRSATNQKLMFPSARITSSTQRHFYFSRLPRLWNFLPHIDLNKSIRSIKSDIKAFFWRRFLETFDFSRPCTFHVALPYLYPLTVIGLLVLILSRPSVQPFCMFDFVVCSFYSRPCQ